MKIKRVVYTILLILFLSVFSFVLVTYKEKPVEAATTCPSGMSDYECYQYLSDLYDSLTKQQTNIQKQLSTEQYNQLSLSQKLTYTNNQITQTENVIKTLEVEIAAENIQISLLESDIQEKEDSVSLLRQEVTVLEQTVNQRVTESYKYSFVGPLEIFLDSKDLSTVLRKTKYLIATRTQDIASLEDYSLKITSLKKEEDELSSQKADLQAKKEDIEKQRTDLAEQNNTLAAQKAEQSKLLAESQAKEEELLATYKKNKELQSEIDAKLTAYVNAHMGEMTEEGYVAKGKLIGYIYPGGNSCSGSTGPHLHFAITTTTSGTFIPNVDIYKGGYLVMGSYAYPDAIGWKYPYVFSGKYQLPLSTSNAIITQDYHDPNGNYIKDPGETSYYATDLSKVGGSGNVPVVAAESGTLYRYVDYCGQDYVIIRHSNGWRTMYLHITYSR